MSTLLRNGIFFLLFQCIQGNIKTNGRIIGGRKAMEGEFPYQVSLLKSYNDKHYCGGVIISPKLILTAAHCVMYSWGGVFPPSIISVLAGQTEVQFTPQSIYRNVSNIIVHQRYEQDSMINDIAILELEQELPSNKLIYPIPIRKESINASSCIISGWGLQNYILETYPRHLLAATIHLIDHDECQKLYNAVGVTLYEGMICAGDSDVLGEEKDACQGDSGGPLVCDGLLTGIISTGIECANPDFPGIYTNIPTFYSWIRNSVEITTKLNSTTVDDGSNNQTSEPINKDVPTKIDSSLSNINDEKYLIIDKLNKLLQIVKVLSNNVFSLIAYNIFLYTIVLALFTIRL